MKQKLTFILICLFFLAACGNFEYDDGTVVCEMKCHYFKYMNLWKESTLTDSFGKNDSMEYHLNKMNELRNVILDKVPVNQKPNITSLFLEAIGKWNDKWCDDNGIPRGATPILIW